MWKGIELHGVVVEFIITPPVVIGMESELSWKEIGKLDFLELHL